MALKKRGGLGSGMSSLFSSNEIEEKHSGEIGRASCRERV